MVTALLFSLGLIFAFHDTRPWEETKMDDHGIMEQLSEKIPTLALTYKRTQYDCITNQQNGYYIQTCAIIFTMNKEINCWLSFSLYDFPSLSLTQIQNQ